MDLLTQTSQAIMSPSKEVFFTNLCGIPTASSKTAVIYRAGHMKCIENLELQTEMII